MKGDPDALVTVRCAERQTDLAEVIPSECVPGTVLLTVYERVGDSVRDSSVYLTPKRAKRLAKALREWEKEAGR